MNLRFLGARHRRPAEKETLYGSFQRLMLLLLLLEWKLKRLSA